MSHKLTGLPPGVCAYYNAPGGCSRGERCSFKHQGQEGVGLKERPQIPASALAGGTSSSNKKSASTARPASASASVSATIIASDETTTAAARPASAAPAKKYVNAQFFSHPTSDPAPPIISPGEGAVSGSWTRGTPFQPKPTFVPKPMKGVLQLSTSTSTTVNDGSIGDSSQNGIPSRANESTAAWSVAGQPKVKSKTNEPTSGTGQQERGMLNIPAGLLQSSSKPSKPSQPQQQTKSFKPKPKTSWSITDRLDLSSLSKLDAITAARPISASSSSTMNTASLSSFPPLSAAAAWATKPSSKATTNVPPSSLKSSSIATSQTKQASASSAAPASVLKSSRSASHKPSSTVSFASALVSGSSNPKSSTAAATVVRRSASAKSAAAKKKPKSSTNKVPAPQKPHKQTQLKKALIRERLENWIRSAVIEPIIWKAVGLEKPVLQPLLPETIPEREKALSELKKKLKFEAYQRKLEEIDRNRQEKKAKKLEEKMAREMKAADASSSEAVLDTPVDVPSEDSKEPLLVAVLSPVGAQTLHDTDAVSPRLPDEVTSSPSDKSEDEIESETDSSESEVEESKECRQKFSDEDEHEENGSVPIVDDATGDNNTVDDEDQVELIPAAAPPSTHAIGYFPSASPPSLSSVAAASSSDASSVNSGGIRTLFNRSIPSSYQLSAAEQALLNWHFQFKHHGTQPKLEGACKRHCKQMWKSSIDQIVFSIVRDLHVHDQRSKEKEKIHKNKDAPARAVKQRLVSGLKQCFKMLRVNRIKCVIVAAHIEANASAGGLDDLLDDILALCEEQRVPVVYALDREKLGTGIQTTNASSAVGILDYSTVGDSYRSLLSLVRAAQEEWGMFQEDAWLNPRPSNWMDSYAKDLELMRIKKEERERKKKTHNEAVSKAEAKRKEMQLALRMEKAAKRGIDTSLGVKKKNHGGRNSDRRELLPLPVLTEEQMKKKHRKRKGQHKAADDSKSAAATTVAPTGSSSASSSALPPSAATPKPVIPVKGQSTASALKGAGKALAAIAEAVQEEKPAATSSTSEKGKRGKSGKKEDQKSSKKRRK